MPRSTESAHQQGSEACPPVPFTSSLFLYYMNKPVKRSVKPCLKNSARNLRLLIDRCSDKCTEVRLTWQNTGWRTWLQRADTVVRENVNKATWCRCVNKCSNKCSVNQMTWLDAKICLNQLHWFSSWFHRLIHILMEKRNMKRYRRACSEARSLGSQDPFLVAMVNHRHIGTHRHPSAVIEKRGSMV